MITFTRFGKDGMNLGNQLHQVASLTGLAEKYNCGFVLPEWKYAEYFERPPQMAIIEPEHFVKEEHFHFIPDFWDKHADQFRTKNTDILGFLQSEKYWLHCREKVLKNLSFKKDILHQVRKKFPTAFHKEVVAVSIRRGDFLTDPNHYLLPLDYYLKALSRFFGRYRDYNVIVFSDDINYCLLHIKRSPNIYFSRELTAIEQLALMSQCDHFIISNSTFSWWGAMLGEKQHSKVIRPAYHFDGELLKKCDWKDYYPERWTLYDHAKDETDISRFIVPFTVRQFRRFVINLKKTVYRKRKYLKAGIMNRFGRTGM